MQKKHGQCHAASQHVHERVEAMRRPGIPSTARGCLVPARLERRRRGYEPLVYDAVLHFEAEKEDGLRKVGYSKERRVDPQIVVGLLVDASGFPLEIARYEGNKPKPATIISVLTDFQAHSEVADIVVVADAGMLLSGQNLQAIVDAKQRFIVGSRMRKAPYDLARHFRWHSDRFIDGQIIDTVRCVAGTSRTRPGSTRERNRYGTPKPIT